MGSLMSGWDSNVMDPKAVIYQRNKSFTNEEIAAYWRSMKMTESEENAHTGGSVQRSQRSNTMPPADRKERSVNSDEAEVDGEKPSKINCWWKRSNSAFLNAPPVIVTEGNQKYVAQFNVTRST